MIAAYAAWVLRVAWMIVCYVCVTAAWVLCTACGGCVLRDVA